MNTQQRNLILNKFIDQLDNNKSSHDSKFNIDISQLQFNEDNLPKLDVVEELMLYHKDITNTIQNTYKEVRDVMIHMKQLKNRKKNVLVVIDSMTASEEIKRLSYGLGNQPKQIYQNLLSYFSMKGKVYHMHKFIDRIQRQIVDLEKQYQNIFDKEMNRNNSNNIAEISKILEVIRQNNKKSSKPDTLQQIAQLCVKNAKNQFKQIEEQLFKIPIKGNQESNYKFFDLAKIAMKIVANLVNNCKQNVTKVSGQQGYTFVIKSLFDELISGVILQILLRLRRYTQIDNINVNRAKLSVSQEQNRKLQPYIKQYVAIWNQLQRLRIHLLAQISQKCPKKKQLQMNLENILTHTKLVQINTGAISYMQAMMRFRLNHLLGHSRFVNCVFKIDDDFFRDVNDKNLKDNTHFQDFLEDTMNITCQGVEKALETLNTLVISAIINFTNHNLIFQDAFFVFKQLFSRVFNRLPSADIRIYHGLVLALNSLAAFPRALTLLLHIRLPQQIPEKRIREQLQQVVNNNQQKTVEVMKGLLQKLVGAEWFRYELSKDYQKILQKWMGLDKDCFDLFVQSICRVHAEIIQQTSFSKKYTQVTAIAFEKEVRSAISFYQRFSHGIFNHFQKLLDYIEVLQAENEQDFKDIIVRFKGVYEEKQLRKIWNLRS